MLFFCRGCYDLLRKRPGGNAALGVLKLRGGVVGVVSNSLVIGTIGAETPSEGNGEGNRTVGTMRASIAAKGSCETLCGRCVQEQFLRSAADDT